MDRTVLYREIVRIALDGDIESEVRGAVEVDDVTKEANSIDVALARLQASLKQMRPRYLALSGSQQMRESEKDDFDYLVRQMLQSEQRRVRALEQRELRRYEASKPTGMSRWLANPESEAASETLSKHRQGMFFYLNSMLQQVSMQLAELQQVRTARQVTTRPHKAHAKTANPAPFSPQNLVGGSQLSTEQSQALSDESKPAVEPPPEHMQLLLEEHDELLEELNANLDKAQKAEQSLREIADLQAELSQHLSTQSQQLDSLTTDAFRTTSDISGANEQLERAKRSNRRASRFIIGSSLATGVFLLLINGR